MQSSALWGPSVHVLSTRATKYVGFGLSLVLALALLWLVPDSGHETRARNPWVEGQRLILSADYQLEASVQTPGRPAGQGTTVGQSFVGELVVDVQSATATSAQFQLTITRVDEAEVRLGPRSTLPLDLARRELTTTVVSIQQYAGSKEGWFEVHTPVSSGTMRLIRTLVLGLDFGWGEGDVARVRLEGEALHRYAANPEGGWTREVVRFSRLDGVPGLDTANQAVALQGGARMTLGDHGMDNWQEDLNIVVGDNGQQPLRSRSSVTLTVLSRASAHPVGRVRPTRRRAMTAPVPKPMSPAAAGALRAGGLTFEELVGFLRGPGPSLQGKELSAMFWRSSGLLAAHPEQLDALAQFFWEPALNLSGRVVIIDLLVAVEHPHGQEVLIELIDRARGQENLKPEWVAEFVGRMTLLQKPSSSTARVLLGWYDQGDGPFSKAALYGLGAAVGHLPNDEDALRSRLNARLVADLKTSATPDKQRDLLAAVGNAAQLENVPVIAEFASAQDPRIRRDAVYALRHTDTMAARKVLTGLARDNNEIVQSRALDILSRWNGLEPAITEQVVEDLRNDKIDVRSFAYVGALLRKNSNSAGIEGIRIMRDHPQTDAKMRGRLTRYLADQQLRQN